MAESMRLKCLLQAEDYSLSPLNGSLKYLFYFYLSYICLTGTGDIKYAYTVQFRMEMLLSFMYVSVKQNSYFSFLVPYTFTRLFFVYYDPY